MIVERMAGVRLVWTGLCVALVLAGCGGGSELSLTEYVDQLNVIVDQARQEYEVLVSSPQGGVLVPRGAISPTSRRRISRLRSIE